MFPVVLIDRHKDENREQKMMDDFLNYVCHNVEEVNAVPVERQNMFRPFGWICIAANGKETGSEKSPFL